MLRATATLSILVAKVIGRPKPSRLLDDDTARNVMHTLILDLIGIARIANGESIQNTDDKLVCAFTAADDAVIAAARMHQFMGSRPELMRDERQSSGLDIRIGTGTVLREGNRLSGETVNWAMSFNTMAKPYRTLVSDTTVQYLSRVHKNQTHLVGQWPGPGLSGKQSVFEYIGCEEDITMAMERQPATQKTEMLDIIHGPIIVTMGAAHPVITIGRSAENDLILKYPRVSRKHARIENRQGKFVLVDTSVNGTFVKIGDLDFICIKHDEIPLIGWGLICPGRKASSSSPGAVHFSPR